MPGQLALIGDGIIMIAALGYLFTERIDERRGRVASVRSQETLDAHTPIAVQPHERTSVVADDHSRAATWRSAAESRNSCLDAE